MPPPFGLSPPHSAGESTHLADACGIDAGRPLREGRTTRVPVRRGSPHQLDKVQPPNAASKLRFLATIFRFHRRFEHQQGLGVAGIQPPMELENNGQLPLLTVALRNQYLVERVQRATADWDPSCSVFLLSLRENALYLVDHDVDSQAGCCM